MKSMKTLSPLLFLLFLSILLLCPTVRGEYQLEYTIEVESNGLAKWVIEQRFLEGESAPPSPQLFVTFVDNVKALVSSAELKTGREMNASGFSMTANVSGSYTVLKYQFHWSGFAAVYSDGIMIGDVFEVEGLFLYGEGIVNIIYPSGFIVESVSPQPHSQSSQKLTWWGIKDFKLGEPKILLVEEGAYNFVDVLKENAIIIIGAVALAVIGATGLYHFRLRKKGKKEEISVEPPTIVETPEIEDSEEKIVNLLKAAEGRLLQSAIADRCKFSKAKTSILLSKMEKSGIVKRYEKGREKLVALTEGSEDGEAHEG